jgi:hypothetical protein
MIQGVNEPYNNPSLFERGLSKLIRRVFAWKTRRMIFLSSIYGLVLDISRTDTENAEKLSRVLNIGRSVEGIEFPIAIKSVIWYNRISPYMEIEGRTVHIRDLSNPKISEEDSRLIIDSILARMPSWLKYAKLSQMRYDLTKLASLLQTQQSAQA